MCGECTSTLPDDLVMRVEWAYEQGDAADRQAAKEAVRRYTTDGS